MILKVLFMEIILKKKISIFLILLLFISNFAVFSYATSNTLINADGPTVYAKAAVLYDVNTNKLLYEKNAYEKLFPASTTKTMTAILAMEHCKLTLVIIQFMKFLEHILLGYWFQMKNLLLSNYSICL